MKLNIIGIWEWAFYGLTGVVSSSDTKFYARALRPSRKYFSLSQQGARIKIWSGDETKQVGHLWLEWVEQSWFSFGNMLKNAGLQGNTELLGDRFLILIIGK